MERSSSVGTSWADQWDYSGDPMPVSGKKTSHDKTRAMDKTKAIASTGIKKVKEGTTNGLQWIKEKYRKKTRK